jgi:hypothetical protein
MIDAFRNRDPGAVPAPRPHHLDANKWLAVEEEIPDPVAGLRPPHVPESPVPVFAAGDLRGLERACTCTASELDAGSLSCDLAGSAG